MNEPNKAPSILMISFLGGINPRLELQAVSFNRAGYEVTIISWKPMQWVRGTASFEQVQITTNWSEMVGPFLPRPLGLLAQYAEFVWRTYSLLKRKVDRGAIVWLTHPILLLLARGLTRRGAKVILDQFELFEISLSEKGITGKWFAKFLELLAKSELPRISGVCCIPSRDDVLLNRLRRYNSNTIEIRNYPPRHTDVDVELLADLREKFQGKPVVVYAGRLVDYKGRKNFPEIVRMVAETIPHVQFIIIGNVIVDGPVEDWIEEEGIAANCAYQAWVSPRELHTWLQVAGVGLELSLPVGTIVHMGEGMGRKLFTYMAAGLPVVVPDHGEAWNLVSLYEIGLRVNPADMDAICAAVVKLLQDEALRGQMGRKALGLIDSKFHWEAQEAALLKLVNQPEV